MTQFSQERLETFNVGDEKMSYEYRLPLTDRHPWVVLLGWFPLIYAFGVVRHWGKPWCMWDGGFVPISCPLPALWWPTRLYKRKKWERRGW